ncbi:MAG: cytochrome c [Proteobacteria bacterium]|nr:cytochrome c [Pseudomonadota bacterium]
MIKSLGVLGAALLLAACVTPQEQRAATLARGHDLAATHCSSCHAVERQGQSPAPEAPPFSSLSHGYRVSTLDQALNHGISVGHPAMPEFRFAPNDVQALVLYLQSIQDMGPGS